MEETKGGIMRGFIDGKEKYCRVGIRRRRATVAEAMEYLWSCISDVDRFIADNRHTLSEDEMWELRHGNSCMVTAIVALKKMEEANEVCTSCKD